MISHRDLMQSRSSTLRLRQLELEDAKVAALWSIRLDTADMARQLNLPESLVHRALVRVRDAGKAGA